MASKLNGRPFRPVTPGITPIPEDKIDPRSDEELIETLKHPIPVRHERNVGAFWNTGFDKMRPWTQRNVIGWIRRQGPSWDVRLLDMVPGSSTNVQNFVEPEYLPECFRTAPWMALLRSHGGVWLDVGSVLFRNFGDIFWKDLEDPASPFEMGIMLFQSRKFIGQCLTGFFERWKYGRTNCFSIHEHPLLKPLGLIVPPEEQEHEYPRTINLGGAGGFDLKITTDYLGLNMAYERIWKSHEMLLQDKLFPLLSLPFEPEHIDTEPQQKDAADYVGHVLVHCSMAKYSQGHWQPGLRVPLALVFAVGLL
ncbi:hypothetical protein F4678DRAFT_473497 [Xylaria arbuscula]|nr:hypothetical protein F4678DRAFT_473497 [Xylaria arbuscula]